MAEKSEITINDEWKVVHVDSMNWQVFQRRKITENKNPTKNKRVGEVDWVALPAFFNRPESACEYVFGHMGDNAGKRTLREFINLMKSARAEVLAAKIVTGNSEE